MWKLWATAEILHPGKVLLWAGVQRWPFRLCMMSKGLGLVVAGKAAVSGAVAMPTCQTRPLELRDMRTSWCPVVGTKLCHAASGHSSRGSLSSTSLPLGPFISGGQTVVGKPTRLPLVPDTPPTY